MGVVIIGSLYGLKKVYNIKSTIKQRQMTNNNIIPIIHSTSNMSLSDKHITINTHMKFLKAYETMDKDKDIHLILHTVGGSLSSSEAIINCILQHKLSGHKGEFIAYIPYYSYSGGCFIALACSKIVMATNAILGPCDALQSVTNSFHSIASIIDAVEYKKGMKEKIDESWLANAYDSNLCKERQLKSVKKFIEVGLYDEKTGMNIYSEFFSGNKCHDQIFSVQEALQLGLNVEIVNEMPNNVKHIVDYLVD
jgi:hypothetical protein